MLGYVLFSMPFAGLAMLAPRRSRDGLLWAIGFVMVVLFVGLRHKVGMDWNNYLRMSWDINGASLWDALDICEPGYALLLWASTNLGAGVYLSNLIGTVIFATGVFRFARRTPEPWIAIMAAIPMLIIVVAMSANRQAIAIGILMWMIADWERYTLAWRLFFIALAMQFHASAIAFLFFAALDIKFPLYWRIFIQILLAVVGLYILQSSDRLSYYDNAYVSGQSDITLAAGATLHVLLNGAPALLMLAGTRYRKTLFPTLLLQRCAWLAIALIPLSFFASAASSRMSLYLFPVSMSALSALPGMFSGRSRGLVRYAIVLLLLMELFGWLAFANSSSAHIPYANYLTIEGWQVAR